MVGGGIKPLSEVGRPMSSVLPKGARWIRDSVSIIDPKASMVTTEKGHQIKYDFLVIALGLEMHYDKVKCSRFSEINYSIAIPVLPPSYNCKINKIHV